MEQSVDTVRLRGHHLLCMLTFAGAGYTPRFTANFHRVAQRINAGATVQLVQGPDDICQPMLNEPSCHCREERIVHRDQLAQEAVEQALANTHGSTLDGQLLTTQTVQTLRQAFADGRLRVGCYDCQWSALCDDIAAGGFVGVKVQGC